MKKSIATKLATLLMGPIDSECKALYLLAETRKLLDAQPPDPVPFALRLYCNWALHVDLTNRRTTKEFIDRAELYAESVRSGNSDILNERPMLREFVSLATF